MRALGITRLSIFGSTARDEARPDVDVDLTATIDYAAVHALGPFGFLGMDIARDDVPALRTTALDR